MIGAGMNVARINFSHSGADEARELVKTIRELNDELGANTAILADLQGPKIRVGEMAPNTVLESGQSFRFVTEECVGDSAVAYIQYDRFPADTNVGDRVLLDDGKLEFVVKRTDGEHEVETEVIHGGPLSSKKGVNLPNTQVSIPCLTEKDRRDLEVAIELSVEWIGLSFVRSAEDVRLLKDIIRERQGTAKVVAKIEKPEAVADLDAIIRGADGLMVARGDLGVEIPMEEVPIVQKLIVSNCRRVAKPVIIATQMMESMMSSTRPTRAEANDVANSVLDLADAVMLSGETSVGNHPVRVIEAMSSIIRHSESSFKPKRRDNPPTEQNDRYVSDTICYTACKMASQIGAKAIITMTNSGYAGFKLSSHRPNTTICVFTDNRSILNMLSLVWGVRGFFYDGFVSTDDSVADIQQVLIEQGFVEAGDMVINTASMPMSVRGTTNALKISVIE